MQTAPVVESLLTHVRQWVGVEIVTHRFGGAEFRVGKAELAHLHSNGTLDVYLPLPLRNRLVDDGWASVHHVLPCSGWVTYALPCEEDDGDFACAVKGALRLLRVAYLRHTMEWAASAKAIPMLLALCDDGELTMQSGVMSATAS